MCGIAGVARRGRIEAGWLEAMAGSLAHRGPDGEGTAQLQSHCDDVWRVGFAHRRLAVFDPRPQGAQPMTSRSGRTTLVMNGEIYNHPELRRRLPDFPWRTGTDTEVLLELFERHGPGILPELNGMFAFAVFRHDDGTLFLGRDRLGIKPLFYRLSEEGLVFASELRGILAGPPFARRLDPAAVSAYLDFGFVPAPMSALAGVSKLPPGSLLEWRAGSARLARWWQLPEPGADARPAWREELYTRLVESVRLRLRSDVPVGCFLSGGVDSTLLSALALRERGDLETFSVSFPEARAFDESTYAQHAARVLGTRHWDVPVTASDVRAAAPSILDGIDEPFADSSLLPVHFLSAAARARVTVALAGDGADELFAGYRRYGVDRWLSHWRRIPPGLRTRVAAPLVRRLADDRSTRVGDFVRRARKVIDADGVAECDRGFAMARIFAEADKARIAPSLAEHAAVGRRLLRSLHDRQRGADRLDTNLRVDLTLGLPDDMLAKVDRASMAHGLEVRVPFLDHRFVEHAAGLPSRLKRRGGRSKAALLEVFGAAVPARVRRRRKSGFDAPLTSWLRGPLRELMHDTLAPESLARRGLLASEPVRELVDGHESGRADHAWRLWSVVVLADWSARHGVA